MNVGTALELLTPGELEICKQDWRADSTTWRRQFMVTHLTPRLDGLSSPVEAAAVRAKWNEIADALEAHFNELPERFEVVRGEGLKRYV